MSKATDGNPRKRTENVQRDSGHAAEALRGGPTEKRQAPRSAPTTTPNSPKR